MTIQRIKDQGINLNTLLLTVSILGGFTTAAWFLYPLNTLPGDMKILQGDMKTMQHIQTVQTEAIRTLAEIAKDTKEMRRDFDKHSAESNARHHSHDRSLDDLKRRLEKIETLP
jgi:hypothetical protein